MAGHSLAECVAMIGDSIEQIVQWHSGNDLAGVSGQPVMLQFDMKDADLYSLRFRE